MYEHTSAYNTVACVKWYLNRNGIIIDLIRTPIIWTWTLYNMYFFAACNKTHQRIYSDHWRKSRGNGGMYPPPPPLFEDKITLYLTFIVKKLTFLTVKLLKTQKIARSHTNVFWDSNFAVLPVFFSWHHLCKERCRIKQTLCNSMARKSIAGLPIIQVKGTWRSQGGIILAQKSPMTKEWNSPLKYCSFLCVQSLVHIKKYFWNLIYKMYFILPVWCKQC